MRWQLEKVLEKQAQTGEMVLLSKNGYLIVDEDERVKIDEFSENYKDFMAISKSERKTCRNIIKILGDNGFANIEDKKSLLPGDRVFRINRGKGIMAAIIGSEIVENGLLIIGSHIDSPRLDLKPQTLYESLGLAYFKTHYYGGIKKYQWVTIPLSLEGVIVKENGEVIDVSIGESNDEPCFCISDLLPHLAQKQMKKPLDEAIDAQMLNVLIGSTPLYNGSEAVKLGILKFLNEKYGVKEEDLISAELEMVPSLPPRDIGFDKSMIGAYGHDDRVCVYTSLRALCATKNPKKTTIGLFVDKEEIGSCGNTGMRSRFFEDSMFELLDLMNLKHKSLTLKRSFSNSICISADVDGAVDPNFLGVFDKRNSSGINSGVVLTKYTGAKGKSGASDASAELVARMRRIFNKNKVVWQPGNYGKVDEGGGGTIAAYVAELNIDTIDCGVPVLSMHSPYEIVGKLDVYMAYKGYLGFYKE